MQSLKQSLSCEPSTELLEAQERLLQLRERLGIAPAARVEPRFQVASQPPLESWALRNAQAALHNHRLQHGIASIAIAASSHVPPGSTTTEDAGDGATNVDEPETKDSKPVRTVTVHPTIALAILRQHLEAPARIYFLLRVIDQVGRGWLPLNDIRRQLTEKKSPLQVCGWRRLRQLLKQGEGVFWQRDAQGRLWLKGAHKIAYMLDVGRLQGFPIELPVETLLGGLQAVRAAFYGSFHGGRDAKPISRETLEHLSGVAERTQRVYDQVASIKRRHNIAIGESYTQENTQARAWKQGRATFHFVDTQGQQGRKHREYVAWHLPNSYQATYQRRSRGSRKRLNRKLADLFTKGITGTDEHVIEKVFFPNGALAARKYTRELEHDAYWQQQRVTRGGCQLWHVMSGMV